jgi:hypothetical protein
MQNNNIPIPFPLKVSCFESLLRQPEDPTIHGMGRGEMTLLGLAPKIILPNFICAPGSIPAILNWMILSGRASKGILRGRVPNSK